MSILQSLRKMLRRKNELAEELGNHLRMAVADRVARDGVSGAGVRA
jgi:hypothetical protein